MAFNLTGFKTLSHIGSIAGAAGTNRAVHAYVTEDDGPAVETGGYFDAIAHRVRVGDIIMVSLDMAGSPSGRIYVVSSNSAGVVGITVFYEGAGAGTRAVVPTDDGLTTGLILPTDRFVEATSANAAHILTLPIASENTRGREIWIWVKPSTSCELRTPDASAQTINNVNGDGTNEALLTHSQLYICRQHLATGWLLQAFTALGAVATPIVPD